MSFTCNAHLFRAATHHTSGEKTRYYLGGVHVEPHDKGCILVATDGHTLVAILDRTGSCDEPVIVSNPPTTWLNSHRQLTILKWSDDQGKVCSPAGEFVVPMARIDGTFPDWRRVMPKETDNGVCDYFASHIVARMAQTGTDLARALDIRLDNRSTRPSIGMTFFGEDTGSPCLVRWCLPTTEHFEAVGVLMPVRSQIELPVKPEWC